jgi:hypothetical protein
MARLVQNEDWILLKITKFKKYPKWIKFSKAQGRYILVGKKNVE